MQNKAKNLFIKKYINPIFVYANDILSIAGMIKSIIILINKILALKLFSIMSLYISYIILK